MIDSILFHPLTWDNDIYLAYGIWVLIILASLWFVRFLHKSFRKTVMSYKGENYYLCRDIFMQLNGFEYLLFVCVIFACYLGYWAYKVSPFSADWSHLDTYLVILPQFVLLVIMIVVFFLRYFNFRKPYLK